MSDADILTKLLDGTMRAFDLLASDENRLDADEEILATELERLDEISLLISAAFVVMPEHDEPLDAEETNWIRQQLDETASVLEGESLCGSCSSTALELVAELQELAKEMRA